MPVSIRRLILLIPILIAIPIAARTLFPGQTADWLHDYLHAPTTDAIARLQEKIDSGEVVLKSEPNWGYLRSVLQALNIPLSSQSLVFSRTSFQLDRIAPWNPRALYFNDDVYVGWVQGGPMLEVAAADPNLGAVFYTMNQSVEGKPKFERQGANCLQCHDSMMNTGGVPGFMVQSVYVDRSGYPMATAENPVASDRTPLRERFGGWYVTGTHGDQVHMGNVIAPKDNGDIGNTEIYLKRLDLSATGNVTDLSKFFGVARYPAKSSDIVALMLLAHQTSIHTLMVQTRFDRRTDGPYTRAEALVRALLFCREAVFTAPIKGNSSFAEEFSSAGPRDRKGRSLRDLDLNTRLLKYPLSYLIYSEGFDGLPGNIKTYVAKRLLEVLTGKDDSPAFAHLSTEDRRAILEIVRDTKPGVLVVPPTAGD